MSQKTIYFCDSCGDRIPDEAPVPTACVTLDGDGFTGELCEKDVLHVEKLIALLKEGKQ